MEKISMAYSRPILAIILSTFVLTSQAQVIKVDSLTHWRKAFAAGLNLNQSSFSSNWKAGGVNSFGFNAYLNYKANYKNDKNAWDNEIDVLYGMVNNAGLGNRKTIDRIFLDTRYGRAINAKWDYSASTNFQSQFAPGRDYAILGEPLISDIFAPAYITAAFGVEYHPVSYFKMRLSPLAPRVTIVNDVNRFYDAVTNPTPYGVNPGESTRFQWWAFQLFAEFDKDIAKNFNLKCRYIMFMDYRTIELNRIDHRLDLKLTAKVNEFINVSFGGIAMYFHDQDQDVQISQALSLGVAYAFQNFADKK